MHGVFGYNNETDSCAWAKSELLRMFVLVRANDAEYECDPRCPNEGDETEMACAGNDVLECGKLTAEDWS
jgi:hypothetical protein